jgi:hypothetical protein
MHWGWRIAVGYSLFVIGMIALVIAANRQTNDLVTEDYYARELAYQEIIDAKANAAALEEPFAFRVAKDYSYLELDFPAEAGSPEGKIFFYRPSDASVDFHVELSPDAQGLQRIPLKGLLQGFWRVNMEWTGNGTPFYNETTLNLP